MHIVQQAKTDTVNIALDTIKKNKQALCFVNSKRSAQKQALDIARATELRGPLYEDLARDVLDVLSTPTDQCKKLAQALRGGVAFHHAGLHAKQRNLIEDNFRKGIIKIICSTPTLAAGLDLPAFRAILKDMRRFSGSWGMQYIPVLEYQQMSGRAGRPGKEDFGEAIMIAGSEKEKTSLEETYIHGEVEDIYSKLAAEPVLRVYVLSLLATRFATTKKELTDFFSQTFWASQFGDLPKLDSIIARVVGQLKSWGFLQKETDKEFETAADLILEQSEKLIVTKLGIRISQLYLDPLSAHIILDGAHEKVLTQIGIVQLLCNALEMRPLLRVKAAEGEKYNAWLLENEEELLLKIPTLYDVEYEDFFKTIKTTAYFTEWLSETTEDKLLTQFDIRPGEINAKNDMLDWLLHCTIELFNVLGRKDIKLLVNLRSRLKYGVKEELLDLLRLKGVGRVRARGLFDAGFTRVSDVKKARLAQIEDVVGKKMAANIKNQLGEDVLVEKDNRQTTLV